MMPKPIFEYFRYIALAAVSVCIIAAAGGAAAQEAVPPTSAAEAAPAAVGFGQAAGLTYVRDLRARFIESPMPFIGLDFPWRLIAAGDFQGAAGDEILMLDEGLRVVSLVYFEHDGMVAGYRRGSVSLPEDAGGLKDVLLGRFESKHDGFAALTDRGVLLYLWISPYNPAPPGPDGKPIASYPGFNMLHGAVWANLPPGAELAAVGRINGDPFDDLLVFDSESQRAFQALSDGSSRFIVEPTRLRCPVMVQGRAVLADMTGSGSDELVCFSEAGRPETVVFADGSTAKLELPNDVGEAVRFAVADVLGDLRAEIVAAGERGSFLYRLQGQTKLQIQSGSLALPEDFHTDQIRFLRLAAGRPLAAAFRDIDAGRWVVFSDEGAGTLTKAAELQEPSMGGVPEAHIGRFREQESESILLFVRANKSWAVSNINNRVRIGGVRLAADSGEIAYSDAEGWYHFPALPAGARTLSASAIGFDFQREKQTAVVSPGGIARTDFLADLRTEESGEAPSICNGFQADLLRWGRTWPRLRNVLSCPAGSGIFGTDDIEGLLYGDCCPLPHKDIYTNRRAAALDECPTGFVVESHGGPDNQIQSPQLGLMCRQINPRRYQLGPRRSGLYWGMGFSHRRQSGTVNRRDIPIAIRFGLGRNSQKSFDRDGCVGDPPGSLLVSKQSKTCPEVLFSELQYRGAPGDPPQGTPVQMYPSCLDISSPFDPVPECISPVSPTP